jgi:hypothetical protein
MFYFYTNELHFTPEFLGRVRLAGSIASLAGGCVGVWTQMDCMFVFGTQMDCMSCFVTHQ